MNHQDLELTTRRSYKTTTKNELHNFSIDGLEDEQNSDDDDVEMDGKYGKSVGRVNYSSIPIAENANDSNSSQPEIQHSPISSSFVNLASTVIGAGILGLPYAFSRVGWFLGTFSLLLCGFLSYAALHLFAECVKKVPPPCTFYSVADVAVPQYSKWIDFAVMLKGIGVATSYLIVILNSLPKAFHPFVSEYWSQQLFENRVNCLFLTFILILPLSYFPHLESLKYSSLVSLFMILFLVLLIVLYSFHLTSLDLDPCVMNNNILQGFYAVFAETWGFVTSPSYFYSSSSSSSHRILSSMNLCEGKTYFFPFFQDYSTSSTNQPYSITELFRVFPIFLFSYTCQQNTYNIISELERPTPSRMNTVFVVTISFCMILYLIVSFSAYLTFGDLITSDVLYSYPGALISSSSFFSSYCF
jgi:amino acid permease